MGEKNTNKIKCILVEDDLISRNILIKYIDAYPGLQLLGTFDNVNSAYEFLKTETVDLMFLDIEMPDASGLNLLDELGDKSPNTIITSSYTKYALDSHKYPVLGYLVKPIKFYNFEQNIDKVKRMLNIRVNNDDFLEFKTLKSYLKIEPKNLIYMEALKDYVAIHTNIDKYIIHCTLTSIENKLDGLKFLRVNRSYIININAVTKITQNTIYLKDVKIPIGVTYKKKVLDAILKEGE